MFSPAGPAEPNTGVQSPEDASPGGPAGLVFDIQAHSVHDGPGSRTTVFMAGCPMSCDWCCNPEGLFRRPVMMHRTSRCVGCGDCVRRCPHGAASLASPGVRPVFDRAWCDTCAGLECVGGCYREALVVSGRFVPVDELLASLERDRPFWGPRGGVTFSGGEPLLQREFMAAALRRCREAGIHVCVETTACVPADTFRELSRLADWVFVDIKHMDPGRHQELTGMDNGIILCNIQALAADPDWPGFVVPRLPVIPGRNDDAENIRATARFVRDAGLEVLHLLPFHRLGESKYRQLGRVYAWTDQQPTAAAELTRLRRLAEEEGLVAYVGAETPF